MSYYQSTGLRQKHIIDKIVNYIYMYIMNIIR